MRRLAVLVVVTLAGVPDARAHTPATAIGRAVEAFASVPVSYEPGAAVSDVEAGSFGPIVGANPRVAFMPASALGELAGGPDAIAEEIAGEASLDGTLVVLVGTQLGTWSGDIDDERLSELEREARAAGSRASPASTVETLVRSIQAEPTGATPWGWVAAAIAAVGIGSLVALARIGRRRARPSP